MQLRIPELGVTFALAGLEIVPVAPVIEPASRAVEEIRFPETDAGTPGRGLEHGLTRSEVSLGGLRRVDVERHADDEHRPALQVPFDRAAAILHPAVNAAR